MTSTKTMVGLLSRRKVLTERQEALLEQERKALAALRDALARFGADVAPGDSRTLDDTIAHLDELFLLVIAGEFNSGKSSFINALLGDKVVAEGVTPTTDRITLLRYAPEPGEHIVFFWRDRTLRGRRDRALPIELVVVKAILEGMRIDDGLAAQIGVDFAELSETLADLHAAGIVLGAVSEAG